DMRPTARTCPGDDLGDAACAKTEGDIEAPAEGRTVGVELADQCRVRDLVAGVNQRELGAINDFDMWAAPSTCGSDDVKGAIPVDVAQGDTDASRERGVEGEEAGDLFAAFVIDLDLWTPGIRADRQMRRPCWSEVRQAKAGGGLGSTGG